MPAVQNAQSADFCIIGASASHTPSGAHREPEAQGEIQPAGECGGSAALFLRILTGALGGVGLIIALTSSEVEVAGRIGMTTKFSWRLFFTTLLTYGAYGGVTWCAAELFENVKRIADALTNGMKVTKK